MGATAKNLHVDKVLTQMAMGYRPSGFIADTIFPKVRVDKQSDIYLEFDRGRRLRRQETRRSPGTEAHLVNQDFGSATYHCHNYALKAAVTIEDKANADPMFVRELINGRVELILDDLMLDKEMRVAGIVNNVTNVGSSSAVSSAWGGAGHVLVDINAAIDAVRYSNGIKPNICIMGPEAWDSARRDTTVRDLIYGNGNGGGYVSEKAFADLLGLDNFQVAGSFKNTGDAGQGEVLATVWGDNVFVGYNAPSPTRERPSYGYEFRWVNNGLADMAVERHPYDTRKKSEEVEVGYYSDEKITGKSYGYLITSVNSST